MTRKTSSQPSVPPQLAWIAPALAAWLIPGAGHWMLGRKVRALLLLATIQLLFWSGVAIGGVFTVNPRLETWWSRAQLCAGAAGVYSYARQASVFDDYLAEAERQVPRGLDQRETKVFEQARNLAAADNLALVPPADGPAYVFTGVAGMLNILCIIDVIVLGLLGHRGEAPVRAEESTS